MTTMRERLLSKAQPIYKEVKLPDGDTVCVRRLSDGEQIQIDMELINRETHKADFDKMCMVRLMTVARSLVDNETKERLFADDEWEQFSAMPFEVINPIFMACQELKGDREGLIKELVGNSN